MARQAKTQEIIDTAYEVLSSFHPMSVRQVYYRLVARQVIDNNIAQYKCVSRALVSARRDGSIPWEWMEDRTRIARSSDGNYDNLADFAKYIQYYYSRGFWATQETLLEVWLEKDALSSVFSEALTPYRVTLNVGKGFDGWDSLYKASRRYGDGKHVTILYFGDFDPSGEEMCTSLKKRLADLGSFPTIRKVSLTKDDVIRYQLPHDATKTTDTRRAKFIDLYGDMAVELDALPPDVLQTRIVEEVKPLVNLSALASIQEIEQQERARLVEVLQAI